MTELNNQSTLPIGVPVSDVINSDVIFPAGLVFREIINNGSNIPPEIINTNPNVRQRVFHCSSPHALKFYPIPTDSNRNTGTASSNIEYLSINIPINNNNNGFGFVIIPVNNDAPYSHLAVDPLG